jgi:hypothetical protein
MATTTNYGWTTPDDTALVKDGAAAIRTLGSSIDTTTKNLNPETTLGDLAYRSSTANVKTRLGLGTAGQILAVNSGATAPEWVAAPTSGGMTLISTTTLSGASVSLTSIPQTYNNLQLVLRNYRPSSNGIFFIRFNSDTGSNYTWNKLRSTATSNAPTIDTTAIDISDAIDAQGTSAADSSLVMDVYDYTASVDHNFQLGANYFSAVSTTIYVNMTGVHKPSTAAAITSMQIACSAGTMSGTALLYGVK